MMGVTLNLWPLTIVGGLALLMLVGVHLIETRGGGSDDER